MRARYEFWPLLLSSFQTHYINIAFISLDFATTINKKHIAFHQIPTKQIIYTYEYLSWERAVGASPLIGGFKTLDLTSDGMNFKQSNSKF